MTKPVLKITSNNSIIMENVPEQYTNNLVFIARREALSLATYKNIDQNPWHLYFNVPNNNGTIIINNAEPLVAYIKDVFHSETVTFLCMTDQLFSHPSINTSL